jgi:hypothetical protein
MARKGIDTTTCLVLGLLAIVIIFGFSGRSTVIVNDGGGVRFDSVRKHPFDVYSDPYKPPERENPYLFGRDYSYQQVGVLNDGNNMLPLFGRPSPKSSSLWEYYTMNGNMKLPVKYDGRTCNSDKGCSEMLGGNKDSVDVVGMGKFNSFIYDTKQIGR